MATSEGHRVIAIEEHYYDDEIAKHFTGADARLGTMMRDKLDDLSDIRIKDMDDGGVDLQVLSHGAPSTQRMDPQTAVGAARKANDNLAKAVAARPDRLQGFAALPTPAPEVAPDELERAVKDLGMKGAMIHGLTGDGLFIDDKRFWPIFERAAALDVPIYLHPATPSPAVVEAYYKDYVADFPGILNAGWGFTVETATAGLRMVLSGVFQEYPNLKIILGHMGEGLPFLLWRINHAMSRPGNKSIEFRETFCKHVYITTSGNFSDSALLCSMMEMGADHILYSVDYPFVGNRPGLEWVERIYVSPEDKVKILSTNAEKLLKL